MPISLQLVTPPRQEPVTLDQVKAHLRLSLDDEDELLFGYIQAARQYLEEVTGRQFLTATWRLGLDGFPGHSCWQGADGWWGTLWQADAPLRLPRPPLQRVTGITYLDSAGVSQVLSYTDTTVTPNVLHLPDPPVYRVDTLSTPGRLMLLSGQSWPSVYATSNAVDITYVAGWTNPALVPPTLKQAMLLLVGHFYEHREEGTEKALTMLPMGVSSLMWINRLLEVA